MVQAIKASLVHRAPEHAHHRKGALSDVESRHAMDSFFDSQALTAAAPSDMANPAANKKEGKKVGGGDAVVKAKDAEIENLQVTTHPGCNL